MSKKSAKSCEIVDFQKHLAKTKNNDTYEELSNSIDYMAATCITSNRALEAMRDTAKDAIAAAGLRFSNFNLTEDSAMFFFGQVLYPLFGDYMFDPDPSEMSREDLDDMYLNSPMALVWESKSKNGIQYVAEVVVEEAPDDDEPDQITVGLYKKQGSQVYDYNFNDSVWEETDESIDDML